MPIGRSDVNDPKNLRAKILRAVSHLCPEHLPKRMTGYRDRFAAAGAAIRDGTRRRARQAGAAVRAFTAAPRNMRISRTSGLFFLGRA